MSIARLLIIAWLLNGCATHDVGCDSKLSPINNPAATNSALRRRLPLPSTRVVSAPVPGTSELAGGPAMSAPTDLAVYLNESHSWDADRAALARRSERNAWYVAATGWACAVAASLALVVLMPLKRVDPFVIRVDNATGVVDVVPAYEGNKAFDETVTRYFLTHYVAVCERFNFATAESDYEECGAFHSAERNQSWYAQWNRNNPNSPLNVHKDGSSVRVQIESVSFFKRADGLSDLAQVRYLKAERQGGGGPERFTHWIGTLQYAYGAPPKDPGLRRWNPLGFRILEMRAELEVRDLGPSVTAASKEGGQS